MPVDFLQVEGLHILNIDHHHDNTRFGTVNLVDLSVLSHRSHGAAPRQGAGRGSHAGASRRRCTWGSCDGHGPVHVREHDIGGPADQMAAELIAAGVEPHKVYRELYQDWPFRRLQLLQRALGIGKQRHDDGASHWSRT